MEKITLVVHILLAFSVIGLVMIQQGKGADAGASFGGGGSQTVFGGQGSGNFLSRLTAIGAAVFFATSMILAVVASDKARGINDLGIPAQETIELLEQDAPFVEAYAPTTDAPDVDVSIDDVPVLEVPAQ
ncbi:MAG: preprotein translocase subunit SecG [Oleispira sp.]|nr:preprotein translocase subunit SecG [Oleispira sp.]MBL4881301.1 preprotein translocase subunit SecG [Oleispira sp.]